MTERLLHPTARRTLGALSACLFLLAAMLSFPGAGTSAPAARAATCHGLRATIVGTAGPNEIHGTAHRDIIQARGGNDDVEARGGNDVVCGGRGNDEIEGNRGNDILFGDQGRDECDGGPGRDSLHSCRVDLDID